MINTRIVNTLNKVALLSDHPKFQMAAAIVSRNTILGIGCNQMKSHPFQAKYGKNQDAIFLHAEVNAIRNALKEYTVDQIKGSTMIIVRRTKKGYGLAKPCDGCLRALVEFGIDRVRYTTTSDAFDTLEDSPKHEISADLRP